MAAEARAESTAPVPEKRAAPADVAEEEEERPGPKRRRAFVATLDGVPCAAAAAEEDGQRDGLSFSFQHSRGGFVPPETTPKFGSFNPPAAAEQQEAPDPEQQQDSPVIEEEEDAASPQVVGDSQDGDSQPLDRKPAPPAGEDSPAVEEEDPASPHGFEDRQDGNSESVAAAADQGEPETQDELECADVHHP